MGTHNENRIICAVIESGDMQPLLDRGLDRRWFFHSDHRMVLEWLLEFYSKHGKTPEWSTLRAEFPGYRATRVKESVEYLVDKQAEYCRAVAISAAVEDAADLIGDGHTETAITDLAAALIRVNAYDPKPNRIVNTMDDLDREWDEYLSRKAGSGMLGYSTGFPTIDKATLGLQKGHLVTVLAQAKAGKTSVCLQIANHVYLTQRKPILFCSFEMGVGEIRMRQRSLMAGISFKNLQAGTLSPIDYKAYYDHLDEIEAKYTWGPFNVMDASSGSTVSAIVSKVQKLRPALLVIDGIYMLHDEVTGEVNTAQALTNITRSLKRVAVQENLPVLINTQALSWKSKGQRISMDSAGYSSSFSQDSDVILGIERYDAKDQNSANSWANWRKLKILASRNSGLDEVDLVFDYDTGRIEEETL